MYPGTFELSTAMTSKEILKILNVKPETEESTAVPEDSREPETEAEDGEEENLTDGESEAEGDEAL